MSVEPGPGQQLGRFVLEKKLGRGAAGTVYLARDTLLNQQVALKVLHDHLVENHEVRERFKREIVLTRRVTHAGVCRLHDLHVDQGVTFITMELVEGQTLAQLINAQKKLTPERTLAILKSLAPPLQAAHDAGVVHRDLKPGNIMVRPDDTVSVLDFGMATADDVSRITHAGRTVGSLRFIAPEVWEGEPATAVSDIYALGVILYACLAGKLPYDATTPAEAFQAQRKPPPSLVGLNPAVTHAVDDVVRKAMARKPADRSPSAQAVLAAFEEAVQDGDTESIAGPTVELTAMDMKVVEPTARRGSEAGHVEPPPTDGSTRAPAVPRTTLIGAGLVVLVVVVAVVAAVLFAQEKPPADEPTATPDAGSPAPPERVAPTILIEDEDPGAATELDDPDAGPRPATLAQARAAVQAVMKRRGFLAGDVPRVDALLARARSLDARGKTDEAIAAASRARAVASREAIDRGFIVSKQKRLRFAAERASPAAQAKAAVLERDVERLVVARDYTAANERLNKAFQILK